MIYLLFATLLSLTIILFYVFKKDIIAPSFIFALSFTFSSVWAIAYAREWQLDTFSSKTFLVIAGGVALFAVASLITHFFYKARHGQLNESGEPKYIHVEIIIKIITALFILLSISLCVLGITRNLGYPITDFFRALKEYDYINKFTNDSVSMGRLPEILRGISIAIAYWYIYIIVNNYIVKKRVELIDVFIVILGMIASMVTGGRNGAVNMMISAFPAALILTRKKSGSGKKLSLKAKILIVIIPILVIVSFPKLTSLVGRDSGQDSMYYLAVYCGAEIKNLDIYLKEYGSSIPRTDKNNMTFKIINGWLGPKLGYSEPYKYDLPFRQVGGRSLGNVYTTFYAYIYDYGYLGMIILTIIMSVVLQIVYERARRAKNGNAPSIPIMLYGYMFSSIVFSFFSNKFYEENVSITFIRNVIYWIIFNQVFIKTRFGRHKHEA